MLPMRTYFVYIKIEYYFSSLLSRLYLDIKKRGGRGIYPAPPLLFLAINPISGIAEALSVVATWLLKSHLCLQVLVNPGAS